MSFPAYFVKESIFALLAKVAIFLILRLFLALVVVQMASTTAMEHVYHAIKSVFFAKIQQLTVYNVQMDILKVQ